MDASLGTRAEQLAHEIASQATTAEDLNGLLGQMMKSAMERMLDSEMDVHLGRRSSTASPESALLEIDNSDSVPPAADGQKRAPNRRKHGIPSIRRLQRCGVRSGRTSSRSSIFHRRFAKRFTRPTRSSRLTA